MSSHLDRYIEEITTLCEQYGVLRLDAIGSVLTDDFSEKSDIDFIVHFHRDESTNAFEQFFGFKESLSNLLTRDIDLICETAIRNRFFRQEVESNRYPLYAA